MEKLGQYHRMATVIGYGMIGTLLIFTAVVETLKSTNFEAVGGFAPSVLQLLRYLFLGITFVEFFVIRAIKQRILSGGGKDYSPVKQRDLLLPRLQKLFSAAIIGFAFCESIAIYGLVLFVIGGSATDFYLFIFLSLVFYALFFPRYSQWEAWVSGT